VLSEFTGTAAELPEAFVVNPYDVDATKDAIQRAASTPADDLQRRMRAMRHVVLPA
jgi:trehalose 6-phosphate synthase